MSGSGGGSATAVVQQHLINMHGDWLARCVEGAATIFPYQTMVDLINGALGTANPFVGTFAYDSETEFKTMDRLLQKFADTVAMLEMPMDVLQTTVDDSDLAELTPPEVTVPSYREAVMAFDAVTSENLLDNVLPRFHAGMRDANATNGSAFVIGRAMLHRAHERDVAAFAENLSTKYNLAILDYRTKWELAKLMARIDVRSKRYAMRYESASWARETQMQLMHYGVEIERMKLTRRAEETAQNINLRDAEFRVPFEAFQAGGNLMAAIAGGTSPIRQSSGSSVQSVIGGALQGMGIGAQVGSSFKTSSGGGDYSGWGALLGGIAGAISK